MQKERLKQDENVRFRILTEVSQQITSILEINDLLTRIVRLIQQTFGYYHVGIGLIEEDEDFATPVDHFYLPLIIPLPKLVKER